jgi:hypothetical protein
MDNLIHVILDKSGSMDGVRSSTISGFNEFLAEQQKLPGDVRFGLTLFDTDFEMVALAKPIKEMEPLTPMTYAPSGSTALLDAIGHTLAALDKLGTPDYTTLVILTDGLENASKEHHLADIRTKLSEREAKGWKILYLGANQDAFTEGASLGVSHRGSTMTYSPSYGGTYAALKSASTATSTYNTYMSSGTAATVASVSTEIDADEYERIKSEAEKS